MSASADLALERLSRGQARASTDRHAPRGVLTLSSLDARLRLDPSAAGRYGPATLHLTATWGERSLDLRFPRALAAEILGWGDDLGQSQVDPELMALLLEAALLADIEAAERVTGRDIRLSPGFGDRAAAAGEDELSLEVRKGEARWGVGISPKPEDRCAIAELLAYWRPEPRAMDGLPFPAELRMGTTLLRMGELRSLGIDDVVLIERGRTGDGMLVIADHWLAEAARQGSTWRLAAPPRPAKTRDEKDWTMMVPDQEAAPGHGAAAADPDEIPVRLAFDVGRLEISLGELRRLGPGSVLDLGRTPDDAVRVTANGRLIGHGRLVDVEGHVGVRLVRLFDVG